jgi:uncharacterized membrane protein
MYTKILLQTSSIIGLLISLYFLLIYKGWTKGIKGLVPGEVCSENTCATVLQTSFANLFKVPNFILGIFYYAMIFCSTFFVMTFDVLYIFLVVSWLVMLMSFYLAYALIFRLRTKCVLCFASHIMNIIIAIIFFILSLS